ncbi:Helix-turn-helix [Rhizobium sp. RU20A]|uniref:helix-turn-helix domain-containing protein n=1 Tax=Rhizobium sp. RU20A TaxID=1907412 RepID=UPI000954C00C|nr:helix-turn-helix transcriptional regulator [Rhizobium sp. RU20A]SIR06496.1 Helix-turn-helix [Rhizobium sp. RU20A]
MQPEEIVSSATSLSSAVTDLVAHLRSYRLKMGLSQSDIAWKLGVSLPTISRWERGVARPDLRAIGAIIDFMRRADSHDAATLVRNVARSRESRNLWEGEDIRYLVGSRRELLETPQLRSLVGEPIRRYLAGSYAMMVEDRAVWSALRRHEIASAEFFGGTAMTNTFLPAGMVQLKRITLHAGYIGEVRCESHSTLMPKSLATKQEGVVLYSWDELGRPA